MNKVIEVIHHIRRAAILRDAAGLTDAQLMGYFVERRDEAAFAALVKQHGPMVWGVCRRLLNHHDAEDAFQATFLVLARKAASILPRERVANWLYGVAHQTALQARRTAARRRTREKQVTEMPEPAVKEQDPWRDLRPLLDQELSRLPAAYREVMVLSDLEGKARKEVARQLGLPEGTVGSRLARARAMLAKRLARHGMEVSGSALAALLSQQAASANVPASVVSSTITAAILVSAGHGTAGVTSGKVVTLITGVLKTMFVNKITVATTVLLALGFLTARRSLLTYQNFKAEEPRPARAAQDAEQVKQGRKQKVNPKPVAEPSRAEQLKAIQDEYHAVQDKILKRVRAGTITKDKNGTVPELGNAQTRFAERVAQFISADPKDEVALDAILFGFRELVADERDSKPYDLLAKHHLSSPKLGSILGRPHAPKQFLRTVATTSPHAEVRGRAILSLAGRYMDEGGSLEAEALLEKLIREKEFPKLTGTAKLLLFEIRNLSIGKAVPDIIGNDLERKPMKLSEYRGKVVLLMFWATWCAPCMGMVPHERELAVHYAERPFAIIGVNGDVDITFGAKGEQIDQQGRVKAVMKQKGITWRSFRNECQEPETKRWKCLSECWNVHAWPTILLIDDHGVIRGKWKGVPDEKTLDTAIEDLVKLAEKPKGKK